MSHGQGTKTFGGIWLTRITLEDHPRWRRTNLMRRALVCKMAALVPGENCQLCPDSLLQGISWHCSRSEAGTELALGHHGLERKKERS